MATRRIGTATSVTRSPRAAPRSPSWCHLGTGPDRESRDRSNQRCDGDDRGQDVRGLRSSRATVRDLHELVRSTNQGRCHGSHLIRCLSSRRSCRSGERTASASTGSSADRPRSGSVATEFVPAVRRTRMIQITSVAPARSFRSTPIAVALGASVGGGPAGVRQTNPTMSISEPIPYTPRMKSPARKKSLTGVSCSQDTFAPRPAPPESRTNERPPMNPPKDRNPRSPISGHICQGRGPEVSIRWPARGTRAGYVATFIILTLLAYAAAPRRRSRRERACRPKRPRVAVRRRRSGRVDPTWRHDGRLDDALAQFEVEVTSSEFQSGGSTLGRVTSGRDRSAAAHVSNISSPPLCKKVSRPNAGRTGRLSWYL